MEPFEKALLRAVQGVMDHHYMTYHWTTPSEHALARELEAEIGKVLAYYKGIVTIDYARTREG